VRARWRSGERVYEQAGQEFCPKAPWSPLAKGEVPVGEIDSAGMGPFRAREDHGRGADPAPGASRSGRRGRAAAPPSALRARAPANRWPVSVVSVVARRLRLRPLHEPPFAGLFKTALRPYSYIASILPQLDLVISKAAISTWACRPNAAVPTTAVTASTTVVEGKQVRVNPVWTRWLAGDAPAL